MTEPASHFVDAQQWEPSGFMMYIREGHNSEANFAVTYASKKVHSELATTACRVSLYHAGRRVGPSGKAHDYTSTPFAHAVVEVLLHSNNLQDRRSLYPGELLDPCLLLQ